MSKLEQLIQELCPNGVKYDYLCNVCNVTKGVQLNKDKLKDNGLYPVINGGINPSGYWDEYNFEANLITISQGGASAGYVNYLETPFWAGAHCYVVKSVSKYMNYRFVYYLFKQNEKKFMECQYGAGIPSLSMKTINETKVPVPPMEVQSEIVRILDNFTLLTAELTAELTARKEQYEYYKNELYKFENVDYYSIGELCTVTKLAGFEFTEYVEYSSEGNIIALRGLNVKNGHLDLKDVKYIDNSELSKLTRSKLCIGDMLFTYVGTIGQVALIEENDKFYLAPNVALIRVQNQKLHPKFMMYYFQTSEFWNKQIEKLLQNSSMKNIPMEKIRLFKIPLPPFSIQKNIVNLLDKFEEYSNDITKGLPAEIELRKQQYEYYRDKLLTFKELK